MNQADQRKIIATSAIVVMSVGVLANVQRHKSLPGARFFVGFGFSFAIMAIFSDLGSPLGGALALLLLTGALLEYTPDVIAWVMQRSGTVPPPAGAHPRTSTPPPSTSTPS